MNPRYIMPLLAMMIFAISACGIEQTTSAITDTPEVTLVPTVTQTSPPPTPTPFPMVVIINGQGITLEEYEAELNRYLTVHGSSTGEVVLDAETIVLEDLISQTLLMQGADENGFDLSKDDLETRFEDLILEAGGEAEFNQWLELSGYDQESLKLSLERSIMAAWMRDQILAGVQKNSPHVNLRQIFFLDGGQADQVLRELESGRDFATTAAEIDPLTGGELGWVPRNFLLHKEIEEAAFALLPGEISQVIETSVGYHIIQVVAIEDERRFSPAARLIWQELALRDWVDLRREASNIEMINVE